MINKLRLHLLITCSEIHVLRHDYKAKLAFFSFNLPSIRDYSEDLTERATQIFD